MLTELKQLENFDTTFKHNNFVYVKKNFDGLIQDGWKFDSSKFYLDHRLKWSGYNRSFLYKVHSFEPIIYLLNLLPDKINGKQKKLATDIV